MKIFNEKLINNLLNVQSKLPIIKKKTDAYNYKYAPLEEIWKEVEKILTKEGFVVFHQIKDDGVKTFALNKNGVLHSFFKFSEYGTDIKNKTQERGKEITYGKRYNIVAIFNIQLEGEDNDAQQEPFKGDEYKNAYPKRKNQSQTNCDKCGQELKTSKAGNKYCPCWYNN